MSHLGSPCGACKFLRRKCVKGCVFAPYFCHDQGATHFAAIHKVFGASNVSKLLGHLPMTDRFEAAITISYEAQARVQDPIYGCVSHIFALQQQVVTLQAQLASLKELQEAKSLINNSIASNPNENFFHAKFPSANMVPQFNPNYTNTTTTTTTTTRSSSNGFIHPKSMGDYANPVSMSQENVSFSSFEAAESSSTSMNSIGMHTNYWQWGFQDSDEFSISGLI